VFCSVIWTHKVQVHIPTISSSNTYTFHSKYEGITQDCVLCRALQKTRDKSVCNFLKKVMYKNRNGAGI
jgi:hypothetical protein